MNWSGNVIQRAAGIFLVLAALAMIPNMVIAEAYSLALGSDKSWGWATRATLPEAHKAALAFCNEQSTKKDCKLISSKAIARAEGGGQIGLHVSEESLATAKKNAIKECGNAACKIVFETTKPGFYAIYRWIPDKEGNSNFYVVYGSDNLNDANSAAKESCEQRSRRGCESFSLGVIAGTTKTTASSPQPNASEKNCRPNTPTVRCSSQCTNGSCIVTYENGCKMRVQVQPRFDSFNNQWTYPAPSC